MSEKPPIGMLRAFVFGCGAGLAIWAAFIVWIIVEVLP